MKRLRTLSLIGIMLFAVPVKAEPMVPVPAMVPVSSNQIVATPDDVQEEEYYDSLELLAEVVEAEAGNQDLHGKKLVVDTVLNRVDSKQFPDTIYDVLTQKNQFTTILNGTAYDIEPSEDSYEAVREELKSRTDKDILYFTAAKYGNYGTPAYRHQNHYFSRK